MEQYYEEKVCDLHLQRPLGWEKPHVEGIGVSREKRLRILVGKTLGKFKSSKHFTFSTSVTFE